jgi:hypothetical protein
VPGKHIPNYTSQGTHMKIDAAATCNLLCQGLSAAGRDI